MNKTKPADPQEQGSQVLRKSREDRRITPRWSIDPTMAESPQTSPPQRRTTQAALDAECPTPRSPFPAVPRSAAPRNALPHPVAPGAEAHEVRVPPEWLPEKRSPSSPRSSDLPVVEAASRDRLIAASPRQEISPRVESGEEDSLSGSMAPVSSNYSLRVPRRTTGWVLAGAVGALFSVVVGLVALGRARVDALKPSPVSGSLAPGLPPALPPAPESSLGGAPTPSTSPPAPSVSPTAGSQSPPLAPGDRLSSGNPAYSASAKPAAGPQRASEVRRHSVERPRPGTNEGQTQERGAKKDDPTSPRGHANADPESPYF